MALFGNSFGVSERLAMPDFIKALDDAAAEKLTKSYSKESEKIKLCSEITNLPKSQVAAFLKVASLMILAQLAEAFPESSKSLSKSELISHQEGVLVIATKLPDAQFLLALILVMKIQDTNFFKNHSELSEIAEILWTTYSAGQSIYQDYFDSHFN